MARQGLQFNPAQKHFEVYNDFSGGMNSETSNERLHDNEFPIMDNVDLSGRGSIRRRTGRVNVLSASPSGNGQGVFFYYRKGQAEPDVIMAVGGKLYKKEPSDTIATEISINGLPSGFQSTLPIEAVQYKDTLFIATGTKLVELTYDTSPAWQPNTAYAVGNRVKANGNVYECKVAGTSGTDAPSHTSGTATDGTVTWEYKFNEWNAAVVQPYKPTAMEAIYIGTNGLADDPEAYIQDQEAPNLSVAIKPSKRSGVTNMIVTMTAFVSKPASITSVKYKWEYRKVGESSWQLGRDFTADAAGKSWDWIPTSTGKYEIRCTVQDAANQNTKAEYTITNYPVNDVEDKANQTLPVESIHTCRKIMLHWDRIILAKDNKYPHQMYISDLNNPRYFPTTNSINFDANKQEPIMAMVRYRDMLVVFTKTTIQTLVGKSPQDYRRALIHDGIGCIADRTAQVIGNHVVFLSNEGVQMLAPSAFVLDTLNVKRIDNQIKSNIPKDENACALVYDNQYWICFPSRAEIYRFYYDGGVWVRDKSSKLNIVEFIEYQDKVYELTSDGQLYKQDKSVYNDAGEVYDMDVESKYYDLSATFHQKKLKRLYVLAKHFRQTVQLKTKVYADSALILTPDSGQAVVDQDGNVVWQTTTMPNMTFYTGTVVGSWILGTSPLGDVQLSVQRTSIRGKCRRVKIRFTHSEDTPCEIYGYGFEFKLKKP